MMLLSLLVSLFVTFSWVYAEHQRPFELPRSKKVLTPNVKSRIQQFMKTNDVNGLTVAVVRLQNGDIEMEGFGRSTEDDDPVTPETLFFIGSCSKAFMATSLGMLMDDYQHGRNTTPLPAHLSPTKFNWSTKVKDLLPREWKLRDRWATEQASLGDILTHMSGLYSHGYSYSVGDTPLTVVESLRYLKPKYEFRQTWDYNNLMFVAGAHIIDTYTKGGFINYVTERIFEPLGMNSSTYSTSDALDSGLLSQAWVPAGIPRRIPNAFTSETDEMIAGAGGIMSNAKDMVQWLKAHMSPSDIVAQHVLKDVTTPRSIAIADTGVKEMSPWLYGMGWIIDYYQGHKRVWHNGGLPGFHTWTGFYPDDDLGIFMSLNTLLPAELSSFRELSLLLTNEALGLSGASMAEKTNMLERQRKEWHHASPEIDIPLHRFAGPYKHEAYGPLHFCSLESDSHPSICDPIRETFASVNITTGLGASWSKVWTKHLSVQPFGEEICSDFGLEHTGPRCVLPARVTFLTVYPQGYGKDRSPFSVTHDSIYGAFATAEGYVSGLSLLDGVDEGVFNGNHSTVGVLDHAYATFLRVDAHARMNV